MGKGKNILFIDSLFTHIRMQFQQDENDEKMW